MQYIKQKKHSKIGNDTIKLVTVIAAAAAEQRSIANRSNYSIQYKDIERKFKKCIIKINF